MKKKQTKKKINNKKKKNISKTTAFENLEKNSEKVIKPKQASNGIPTCVQQLFWVPTCLTVRKDTHIVSIYHRHDRILDLFEYLRLIRTR